MAEKTYEEWLKTVERNGGMLAYVPDDLKTPEFYRFAVEKWGVALEYVPEDLKTPELCRIAVEQYGAALEYVPEHLKTVKLCLIALQSDADDFEDFFQFVPKAIKKKVYSLYDSGADPDSLNEDGSPA